MDNKKSLLLTDTVEITDKLSLHIPTVREILEDEENYYGLVIPMTASPMQYMVQLDDLGIDFAQISDYELFLLLFPVLAKEDTSSIFGDLDLSDAFVAGLNNSLPFIFCPSSGVKIDVFAYRDLTNMIRKINLFKKETGRPGNENAKKYLLEKERRRLKHRANKPYEPYLENMVVALVNTSEFPYDYNSCMDLSIYNFNQSLKQIQRKIIFDNTMIGVYAGTLDTKKMSDKDCLSWLPSSK